MDEEYITDVPNGGKDRKQRLERFIQSRYFIAVIVVLVSVIAFSLGRISGLEEKREPVKVYTSPPNPSPTLGEGSSAPSGFGEVKGADTLGRVVASKNGTKYHYPWCAGAQQISEKNKIYFESIEAASAAGYTPASNCKGLK